MGPRGCPLRVSPQSISSITEHALYQVRITHHDLRLISAFYRPSCELGYIYGESQSIQSLKLRFSIGGRDIQASTTGRTGAVQQPRVHQHHIAGPHRTADDLWVHSLWTMKNPRSFRGHAWARAGVYGLVRSGPTLTGNVTPTPRCHSSWQATVAERGTCAQHTSIYTC